MPGYNTYVVGALPNGTFKFFATSVTKRLTTFAGFPIGEYLAGVASNSSTLLMNLLDSDDFEALPMGTQFYSGYGISGEEMINAGRYSLV